jgi:8-oxo-dGTP pyrophosphatase MutT (NUDIX family)
MASGVCRERDEVAAHAMTRGTANAILRQIEDLGYAVSVHTMPGYVELHAVSLDGDEIPHVARCEGNGGAATDQAACALAGMVWLRMAESGNVSGACPECGARVGAISARCGRADLVSLPPRPSTISGFMPISPYVRALRDRVGCARLLLPSVSAHLFDDERRLLLVRQRDSHVWSTPGGLVEPDERPADAVVRETWEETGLYVSPRRLQAVYGGPEFVVRYPDGDEAQYVVSAFECAVIRGSLETATPETVDARYISLAEAQTLALSPWLRACLPSVYSGNEQFAPAVWQPTTYC